MNAITKIEILSEKVRFFSEAVAKTDQAVYCLGNAIYWQGEDDLNHEKEAARDALVALSRKAHERLDEANKELHLALFKLHDEVQS